MKYINTALKLNDLEIDIVISISKGKLGNIDTIDVIEEKDCSVRYGSYLYDNIEKRDTDLKMLKEKFFNLKPKIIWNID